LLNDIGLMNVSVAGDTRIDRVAQIATNPMKLPDVAAFCGNSPILICGSTWPEDEQHLLPLFTNTIFKDWKFILAPHDIQLAHLQAIESKLDIPFLRYSKIGEMANSHRLLLIDNIGMLSSLYQFGKIAYIGGGFGQAIHNILEPAAFGLPILFGPKHQKFEEANWLVEHGGAFKVNDGQQILSILGKLKNQDAYGAASKIAGSYIENQKGSTQKVQACVESYI
ncbi:MAG: 3-deoxy-D-manno-octulosonic acid transferase, partial [Saprospiraceae bacterium]|nr:3-deoxy-D-manno-octulosonic acid transferase [Saprospiraceae bacterium]